jgi:pimeloyl-ACP methyl ester carboxylesterase
MEPTYERKTYLSITLSGMDRFVHDGIEMAYEDQGEGPAILFLHNGGASSTIWRHQLQSLSAAHRAVAVDLPGFGASPRPGGGTSLAGQVELLGAFIDDLGLAPLLVVGNCMGSNIAVGVAARRPGDVVGLVLVNPLTAATFSAGWLGPLHTMARRAPGPTRGLRRVTRRIVLPGFAARAALRFQVGRKGRALGVHRDPVLVAANRRADQLPALIDVLDDMDAYGELDGGRPPGGPPLCTIWGARNRVLSPRAGAVLADRLGAERTELLAGCGHFPMLEDPEAVTGVIAAFAAAHLVPAGRSVAADGGER